MSIESMLSDLKTEAKKVSHASVSRAVDEAIKAVDKLEKARIHAEKVLVECQDSRREFIEAYRLHCLRTGKRDLSGWLAPGSVEQGNVRFAEYIAKKAIEDAMKTMKTIQSKV